MGLGRIRQIGPGPLQPALADIMREIVVDALEQLLQIALGNTLRLRDPRRRQIGIIQAAFDGLADPVQDRGLSRRVAGVGGGSREPVRERQQEIDHALRDCRPFRIGQCLEMARRRLQHPRKDIAKTTRRYGPHLSEFKLGGHTTMQRFRRHRQHHRAHVALEHDAPVATAWQQENLASRNDPMTGALAQHDAILDGQQHDRQPVIRWSQRCDTLRARRHAAQCHTDGGAV